VSHPRHDRQEAVQKAMRLFWAKGFHATSMRNIQQVTNLRPGSIYATFGSKEALFREALHLYADTSLQRLKALRQASPSPLAALRAFVEAAVTGTPEPAPSSMCMLAKTVAELTEEEHGDLLQEARQLLKKIEAAFAEVLAQAQKQGEVDASRSPERLARYLQMQVMGLRSYARVQNDRERLGELIDDVFHILTTPASPEKKAVTPPPQVAGSEAAGEDSGPQLAQGSPASPPE